MSHQRPGSRKPTATQMTEGVEAEGRRFFRPHAAVLCALTLGIALFGACGQGEDESPAPQPGPTSTTTSLPAVVTYTPMPPTATEPPPAIPTETPAATPTPTVEATDTASDAMEPPASDALVRIQGEMNVRSGPGTDYDVVGDATAGDEFPITGKNEDGNWWQIDFNGETGWIYAPFVIAADADDVPIVGSVMAETPVPVEATAEAGPAPVDAVVTVGGDMNIRSGPGGEYDRIGGATEGETFGITGKSADGDWWQIDFEGETGWIYALFVVATSAENVPVVGDTMTETPVPPSETETAAPETESGVVTILGDMNIREGPGTDTNRIGGATEGEEFDITGKSSDGEWWQIDFNGQLGWVYAPFVTAVDAENVPVVDDSGTENTVPGETTTETPATPGGPVATAGGDLNVREGPGTEYDRIGGAAVGEEFAITGQSSDGEWWQIDFSGEDGWIYAPFVIATNAENVPVVTPNSSPEPTPAPEAQGANSAESGRRALIASISDSGVLGVHFEEE